MKSVLDSTPKNYLITIVRPNSTKIMFPSECYENAIFSLTFVGIVFVSPLFDLASASIISLRVITESSIILPKHLPFLQLHPAGF